MSIASRGRASNSVMPSIVEKKIESSRKYRIVEEVCKYCMYVYTCNSSRLNIDITKKSVQKLTINKIL